MKVKREGAKKAEQIVMEDVGCLDESRVKLQDCSEDDDYIHANYVSTPSSSRRFICTQAPLEKTCRDFWLMCLQERVEFIVMLCNFFEKKLKTRHIHWIDWPDRGVPPPDTAIIQLLEIIRNTQYPIVVHCSAGVGRTGSLVLIQYILESLSLHEPIEDCARILLKIRAQRANTIQTDQQYLFVHQVLLNYFSENQLLDSAWKPHLDRFTSEYRKFVF
ncbi:Protein-tyrosine phosphatase [Dictyocaulus viviparus]|uniref:Protein-tyrosine phosphatase n=1 Tax=Dictyocaulus viviparus TaxID=29172 RepID=A0A0D8Y1E2_DICVI|nr:Protein-tyrosine phosphatase [Dictyocaulus viviparus]